VVVGAQQIGQGQGRIEYFCVQGCQFQCFLDVILGIVQLTFLQGNISQVLKSIGNINTLFSLFQQVKKEIREAVQR
jgi:hypothetical protein